MYRELCTWLFVNLSQFMYSVKFEYCAFEYSVFNYYSNFEYLANFVNMATKNLSNLSNLLNLDNEIGTGAKPPSDVEPPFNHNHSSMPRINKSVDDLLSKLDLGHEFSTGSSKPVSLTIDHELKDMNCSDDSEICAEKLSSSVPKIDYVGKFETISTKFVKNDANVKKNCALKTKVAPSKENENKLYSTINKETGSRLNPKCEPYVPNVSLEQVSISSAPGSSMLLCGKPGHISGQCLHRPTKFFYGKNQKVTPKAKPISKPKRIEKSSKPEIKTKMNF
ncbi:hypothetical protein R6Q57_003642 [Mikania cordata]